MKPAYNNNNIISRPFLPWYYWKILRTYFFTEIGQAHTCGSMDTNRKSVSMSYSFGYLKFRKKVIMCYSKQKVRTEI